MRQRRQLWALPVPVAAWALSRTYSPTVKTMGYAYVDPLGLRVNAANCGLCLSLSQRGLCPAPISPWLKPWAMHTSTRWVYASTLPIVGAACPIGTTHILPRVLTLGFCHGVCISPIGASYNAYADSLGLRDNAANCWLCLSHRDNEFIAQGFNPGPSGRRTNQSSSHKYFSSYVMPYACRKSINSFLKSTFLWCSNWFSM